MRSWSGLSLHHGPKPTGAARPVSTPSEVALGLARDCHAEHPAKGSPSRPDCPSHGLAARLKSAGFSVIGPGQQRSSDPLFIEGRIEQFFVEVTTK